MQNIYTFCIIRIARNIQNKIEQETRKIFQQLWLLMN